MASVFKRGGKHATKNSRWIVSWYDAERECWRTTTAYRDKDLSLAHAFRLENESAARREGWSTSPREHSIKPVDEPLQEFVQHLVTNKRDPNYIAQHERRIRRLIEAAGVKRLLDLDAPKIEAALLKLTKLRGFEKGKQKLAISTRNEYITSICAFAKWAHDNHRIERDPLTGLQKAEHTRDDAVHPRRGLAPEEIARLLDATLRRPEIELLTIRTGKNQGKLEAKVRPRMLERARAIGKRRHLAYLFIVWTGLRRSEAMKLELARTCSSTARFRT